MHRLPNFHHRCIFLFILILGLPCLQFLPRVGQWKKPDKLLSRSNQKELGPLATFLPCRRGIESQRESRDNIIQLRNRTIEAQSPWAPLRRTTQIMSFHFQLVMRFPTTEMPDILSPTIPISDTPILSPFLLPYFH